MSPAKNTHRRKWVLAATGALLLAAGAHFTRMARGPAHDLVLAEACRTPVHVLEPRQGRVGSAVVFHGLSANRTLMQTVGQWLAALGLRVYLVDSPGHGNSAEAFSYGRAEQCAAAVVESLARRGEISPEWTVLAGHSMGGAIAVRLADRFPAAATLAISPAPMNLPRRMPANLLILSAQLDMAMLKDTARKLVRAAGGERVRPGDFLERRAVRLVEVPAATHTSLVFDRRVNRLFSAWVPAALHEPTPRTVESPGFPVVGGLLGLIGLLLIFPLAASGLALVFAVEKKDRAGVSLVGTGGALARWVAAALLAVGVLNFWVPLRALRIFSGDYLASFLMLAGTTLLALLREKAGAAVRFDARAITMAGTLALATVVAFGLWLNWQLTDAWPNAARWGRFVPLVLVCWPYFLTEAVVLGPPEPIGDGGRPGRAKARRYLLFVALRLVLWLALVFALFALGSGQILVVLLAMFLALFAIFERLGADAVWRRTGSAAATAGFGAILTAWFIATVFPLT